MQFCYYAILMDEFQVLIVNKCQFVCQYSKFMLMSE